MDIGAQLREAREARGLSLTKVAAVTRIHAHLLEALERNDLSGMPARPYARGFVAAYAREVGLDAAQTVRAYFAQFEEPLPPAAAPPEPKGLPSIHGRSLMPAAVLGALAVIVAAVLIARTINSADDVEFPATELSPALAQAPPVGTTGTAPAASSPTTASGTAGRTDVSRTGAGRQAGSPSLPAAGGDLVVIIEADGPSWVAATVDGERRLYQILQPGSRHTLRAGREIVLRVGDAGAIRWSVNGRAAAPMGARGEVRTVTLTPVSAAAAIR